MIIAAYLTAGTNLGLKVYFIYCKTGRVPVGKWALGPFKSLYQSLMVAESLRYGFKFVQMSTT
jgi:hypothetical protein